MRPKLKICGVNDAAFAVRAAELGADYLGFIFAAGSPRQVSVETAQAIAARVRAVSRTVKFVGVFTTAAVDEIAAVARAVGLDVIQLHRRATAADSAALKARGWEVWALAGSELPPCGVDALMIDTSHGDGDRTVAPGDGSRLILAGGISAENLSAVVDAGAYIIDVSGSLEDAPGVKSVRRLEALVAAYRRKTEAS